MPFKTKCPGCAKILDVPDSVAGKRVKCPACAHMWQVPAPTAQNQAAFSAPPAATGPRTSKCPGCGKAIQVPDSMVGKRVKCPACAHVWQVPRPVVDAEAVPGSPGGTAPAPASSQKAAWFDDMMSDEYPIAAVQGFSGGAPGATASSAEPPRRPCPRCGEMIAVGAAKCRFCDAIFDSKLRKSKKKKSRSGGSSSDDDEMTAVDWLLCIFCGNIACIVAIVYLCQGKPKGGKMLMAAIAIQFLLGVLLGIINALAVSNHPGVR